MRSVFLMAIANIKKKKVQSILIAITIMVSALLFSTAIGMLNNANKPLENMYKQLNASQTLLIFSNKTYNAEILRSWWERKKGVSVTRAMPIHNTTDKVIFKGEKLSSDGLYITERTLEMNGQDKLIFMEGTAKKYPAKGEVWIPTGFAYANGIKVGDIISIPSDNGKIDMKVSAIVIDPQFSGSLMDVIRIWVTPGEVSQIFKSKDEISGVMLGIRYSDYSEEAELWTQFSGYLKTPFLGNKLSYETISTTYLIIQKIAGAMLLIFSVIIIIVVIFVIAFIISGSLLSDYKAIGILKSQGFSPRNIVMMYSGQYLILSVLSILPGIFLSYFVIKMITIGMIKSIGMAYANFNMLIPALVTIIVLTSIVLTTAWFTSKKSGKIKPADAIRYGEPIKKYPLKRSFEITKFKGFTVTFMLGTKQLISNKKQAFFLFITIAITVFVFVFSVNLYNTMLNLGKNYAYLGYDNSLLTLTRSDGVSHESLLKILKDDPSVKNVIPWTYVATYPISSKGNNAKEGIGLTYDGDMDSIGVMNLEGKNPDRDNEISLSVNTAKAYDKKIGDMINVYIEGKNTAFIVTGIYQSMLRGGWTYRIQMAAIRKNKPDFVPASYAINLKNGIKLEAFLLDMKKRFGNTIDIKLSGQDIGKQFSSATGGIAILALLLCTIFSSMAFIIIFNLTLMNIYRQKKSFGIFKAFGMTPSQIRLSIVYNVVFTSVIGVTVGIPLGLIASPRIMGALMMNMGVAKFPFDVSIMGTIAAIFLCLLIAIVSAWFPSGRILKINPRNLIVE